MLTTHTGPEMDFRISTAVGLSTREVHFLSSRRLHLFSLLSHSTSLGRHSGIARPGSSQGDAIFCEEDVGILNVWRLLVRMVDLKLILLKPFWLKTTSCTTMLLAWRTLFDNFCFLLWKIFKLNSAYSLSTYYCKKLVHNDITGNHQNLCHCKPGVCSDIQVPAWKFTDFKWIPQLISLYSYDIRFVICASLMLTSNDKQWQAKVKSPKK